MKSLLFALFLAVPAVMGYEVTELTDDSWTAEIEAMDTALGKIQRLFNCMFTLLKEFIPRAAMSHFQFSNCIIILFIYVLNVLWIWQTMALNCSYVGVLETLIRLRLPSPRSKLVSQPY